MRLSFSTGVTTLYQAMLRQTLFSHRKLEVPVASLAIIGGSCPDVAFANSSIGTELLAHREKIEVTRSGSPFERSPVPMGRAHCPTRAQFAHFLGRMPQT